MGTMPAGRYYVGDLCYVLNSRWDEFCALTINGDGVLDGEFNFKDGVRFATYGTCWGDGRYHDQFGHAYSVDAGLIGCVLVSACDKSEEEIKEEGLGQIVDFPEPFRTRSDVNRRTDDGDLHFGHIVIDTNPSDEDEEDEAYEEEDA